MKRLGGFRAILFLQALLTVALSGSISGAGPVQARFSQIRPTLQKARNEDASGVR